MSELRDEAYRLLGLARRDARAFDVLIAICPPEDFPSAAFHAQQSVEKCLKAVLISRGVVFRRTHNLTVLGQLVKDAGLTLPVGDADLLRLTPYAVEFRYDDIPMPLCSPEQARSTMTDFLDWTERCLAG